MAIISDEPRDNAPADNRGLLGFLIACIIAATVGVLLTPPPAGASVASGRTQQHAAAHRDRPLPEWVRAEQTSRRAGGRPCMLVHAEFHRHPVGILCANGTAHVLRGHIHAGREYNTSNMPRWFHWAGDTRDSAIQVWAGNGDTSLALGDDNWMSTS